MSWVLLKLYTRQVMNRGWKRLCLYLCGLGLLTIVIDLSGVLRHPYELDYETQFSYPLDLPDFPGVIEKFRNGERIHVDPINTFYSNLTYMEKAENGCNAQEFRLILLVKSAPTNFAKRAAVRATWGNPRRFSDVSIKTVFLIGRVSNSDGKVLTKAFDGKIRPLEYTLKAESGRYSDIVRGNFLDSYYNNTIKTMLAMRWLVETCPKYRFAFFVDDDMYVSVRNLLRFVRHPSEYPQYWENQRKLDEERLRKPRSPSIFSVKQELPKKGTGKKAPDTKDEPSEEFKVWKNHPMDFDIDLAEDVKLFAGGVFFVPPHRHKVGTKWFVPLSEYPYNYYPPYVPAGAMLMSKPAVQDIYYASFFTKPYRFDDIYVAILAKKMGIEPFHSEWFRFWKYTVKDMHDPGYKYLIVSHDYEPEELKKLWISQKELGNA